MSENIKLDLVIEKSDHKLWGRVTYNESLITDEADTVAELETNIRKLLVELEDVTSDIEFELFYDVYALFEQFDFINITKFAKYAGINAGQLRQYASGVKNPRKEQALKIETALHQFSVELQKISVYAA